MLNIVLLRSHDCVFLVVHGRAIVNFWVLCFLVLFMYDAVVLNSDVGRMWWMLPALPSVVVLL